jgi:site-specific DNA-adenine methylase
MDRYFFKYFGSKWARVEQYPAPAYSTIVEPFAGSASYACRYHDRRVILADTNPRIVGIWQYLIRVSPAELMALPMLANGQTTNDLTIPQEARWLIGYWLTPNTSRPMVRPCSWMRQGHRPNSYWSPFARELLARQVELIRHWKIIHGSYEHIENREATWFVDPPYQHVARDAYRGHPNFDALATWCRSRRGQTIVCEQMGANWLPFHSMANVRTRHARTGGATGKTRNIEALWVQP